MHSIDKDDKVLEIEDLIEEIQGLLNHIDSKHKSVLSKEIMQELEISDLIAIRDNLLQKQGKEIEQNQDWLFGLVDS